MASEIRPTFYCANCIHYPVCKLTNEIWKFDNEITSFNTENFDKNRIRISSVAYDCRYKKTNIIGE